MIILSNPTAESAKATGALCWEERVPMVIVRSFGFIGTYFFQSRDEIGIVESRPDGELLDLRLNAPFKELEVTHRLTDCLCVLCYVVTDTLPDCRRPPS